MNIQLQYLNPAGNITAVVRTWVPPERRAALSRRILALGRAEQVGFAVPPQLGGRCRLEMMGGEFCGNAVRSYGLSFSLETGESEKTTLPVEISGARAPVPVTVNPADSTAFADMPLPLEVRTVAALGQEFPVVCCDGICHLLAIGRGPEAALVDALRGPLNALPTEAWGVMFLEGERLTPAVYVKSTDSLVWESSCGSGSVAAAWFLARSRRDRAAFTFTEPGGTIAVTVSRRDGAITGCTMGGPVAVASPETISLEIAEFR